MKPKLRSDLDALRAPPSAGGGIILVDPLKLAGPGPLHVRAGSAALLPLLDGSRDIADLQLAATRLSGGVLVTQASITRFVENLSRSFLLEDEAYESRSQQLRAEWSALPGRPPSQAGTAYPEDPREAGAMIDTLMSGAESPDAPQPWVVVAPHADIRSAATAYRAAYRRLPEPPPARVVVMGTGHRLGKALFSVTDKDYLTPLGRSPSDVQAVGRLQAHGGTHLAADDWDHRSEHSLELQYLFLHHLWGESQPATVAILCGPLQKHLRTGAAPHHDTGVTEFLKALTSLAEEPGTLIVAGIDLSHVGPKFGHDTSAEALLAGAKRHDEALLHHLLEGDPDGVWNEALRHQDGFNVCGLSTILWLACITKGCPGELLCYHVWRQPQFASAVTVAAAVLYRR